MPTQASRIRYSSEAITAHRITSRAVTALAGTIAPHVSSPARQNILDIKVYTTLHTPTRHALRSEPRFKKSGGGLGIFCTRSGVVQPSTGLVSRLHTTADRDLAAPESAYVAADLGLSDEQWLFLCVPGTPNPYTGYGMDVRTGDLRRDSVVDGPVKVSEPAAAEMYDESLEEVDAWYPDDWPRWVPADETVTLTCPACACELTGVVDHSGGVVGYGCSVCSFDEGGYEEKEFVVGGGGGGGVISSLGGGGLSSLGGSSGDGPVFVRPSLLHHYWEEVVVDEKDNEEDMWEGYSEALEMGIA